MAVELIKVESIASTNTYLLENREKYGNFTVIYTDNQSAGRGQRGNVWESTPGKNLTFSLLLKDLTKVHLERQFVISEMVSVAMVEVLGEYAGSRNFSIKWPNDIYYNDSKISGILIENIISGKSLTHSVIGVGLNVNQKNFSAWIPNPVALCEIMGIDVDKMTLLKSLAQRMEEMSCKYLYTSDSQMRDELHNQYKSMLYRCDSQIYPFTRASDGKAFLGRILDVAKDGRMSVEDVQSETVGEYYFKEIAFVI